MREILSDSGKQSHEKEVLNELMFLRGSRIDFFVEKRKNALCLDSQFAVSFLAKYLPDPPFPKRAAIPILLHRAFELQKQTVFNVIAKLRSSCMTIDDFIHF